MKECDCVSLYLLRLIVAFGFQSAPVATLMRQALPRQRSTAKLTWAQPFGDSHHQLFFFFFFDARSCDTGRFFYSGHRKLCWERVRLVRMISFFCHLEKEVSSHIVSSLLLTFNRICRFRNRVWFDGVPNGLIKANCLFIFSFSV